MICVVKCSNVWPGLQKCNLMGQSLDLSTLFMCSLVLSLKVLPVSPVYCCLQSGLVQVTRYIILLSAHVKGRDMGYVTPVTVDVNVLLGVV